MIYDITLTVVDSTTSTTHAGAAVSLQVAQVVGQVNTGGGSGITDGDKGDITVGSSGTVWTVDVRAITAGKLFAVAATRILGRHAGTSGDAQEISLGGGLEFDGSNIRRAALTGPVTAASGSNATTLAQNGAATGNYYKWDGAGWVPAVISYLEDIEDIPSTFTPSAHTHTLSNLTQSGATTNQIAQWNGTAWVPVTFTSGIGGTAGATDNALLRADGTGGATVQASTVTIDDSGNVAHTNWLLGSGVYSSRNYARAAANAANSALVLAPTGTGFICLAVPDGLTAGGNNRGNYAVDLQLQRSAATAVASGAGAALIAGNASTASGLESFVAAGRFNTASADQAYAAGNSCTASGAQSCCPGGFGNTASGSRSIAIGSSAVASLWGQFAHSGFGGTTSQRSELHAYRTTADATASNLFLDGSSARLVVPANSSGVAMITVAARTNTATDQHMTWRRRVNWERGVAVGTVSIDVETVGTDRGYTGGAWGAGPAWTLAITADTTNGAINIIGTGVAATNIRWGASIEWIETTFA